MVEDRQQEELLAPLYVNEAGEVKEFPGHDGRQRLAEARLDREAVRRRESLAAMGEARIPYTTVVWTPIRHFPAGVRLALAKLYQERELARELAFDLYWQLITGEPWYLNTKAALINRARQHDWIRDHPRPDQGVMGEQFSWNQPLCSLCYEKRHPGRAPIQLRPEHRDERACCDCGITTAEGIFIRADPQSGRWPTWRDESDTHP